MKKNIKDKIIRIIVIMCVIVLIISSYILIKTILECKESNISNKELIEDVITEKNNEEKIELDWKKLEDINKDIIGWIRIKDTKIDYPILQDNESLKYLNHSFNGKYNNNGTIFTINHNPFQENVTIIYGHNMRSGLMFSDLSKYMKEEFLNEHSAFEIYTRNQNYEATIFSCYSTSVNKEENNIKLLDFNDEIDYYKKMSKYSVENIGEIKKIVKLSTCSYLNSTTTPTDQRYYIVAKLEKID